MHPWAPVASREFFPPTSVKWAACVRARHATSLKIGMVGIASAATELRLLLLGATRVRMRIKDLAHAVDLTDDRASEAPPRAAGRLVGCMRCLPIAPHSRHLKFARSKVEDCAVLLPHPRRALGDALLEASFASWRWRQRPRARSCWIRNVIPHSHGSRYLVGPRSAAPGGLLGKINSYHSTAAKTGEDAARAIGAARRITRTPRHTRQGQKLDDDADV